VVWDAIETAVGSRARLRAAVDGVAEMIPPAGADPDGQWRADAAASVERVPHQDVPSQTGWNW
jgi:hypothetical protein